ncbi:glycosyltransferase [Plastorhodobacter daqingensis]|uniref:Glycosyltransferase n=1 Tax=Plastorhodobacter daqingensis TaxID=1387281 RepID=A0ABW2UJ80_9RHOB
MILRLVRLFRRYAALHLELERAGPAVCDAAGRRIGQVERVRIARGRLCVSGWALAARVRLEHGGAAAETSPQILRDDVVAHPGLEAARGFELSLPAATGPAVLSVEGTGDLHRFRLGLPGPLRRSAARLRLALTFLRDLAHALPLILRWWRRRDPALRPRIRAALRLEAAPAASVLDSRLFAPAAPPPLAQAQAVSIVLPVYNAFDLLPEVLDRVLRHTDLPWHLIVIEDASPDPAVRPWLRDWVAARDPGQVTLLENETNLGFIRSVNRGLDLARQREGHVVLLNSDAFVPAGWAGRLLAPIVADPDVASVTPLSNDAEIFTVPVICRRSSLRPGQGDAIDRIAAGLSPGAGLAEAPTGVGFCMAMNRAFLARIPALDITFGRGYGEEVDWCQKARALGGRHIGLPGLFVEHRGGESFGSVEKLRLIQKNNAIVAARYPRYDAEVQDFILNDPLVSARLILGLAWAGSLSEAPVPVYVAHSMGGGAEDYLRHRIAEGLAGGQPAVVLRLGGARRWRIELHTTGGVTMAETDDNASLSRLLSALPAMRLVYSCAVGDRDPLGLPQVLEGLLRDGDRLDVLFHDFFPLSPSYTLLGSDGWFHGVPADDDKDPAHLHRDGRGGTASLREWREAWHGLIARADRLVVFSRDSAAHVAAVWPDVAARIHLQPHRILHDPGRLSPGGHVLAVLGNIGLAKGARLLPELARALSRHGIGLVVIGNVDPAVPLPREIPVHGSYRREDLPALAAHYRVGAWLVPSVWPETFSFTTHEALATGLPVLGFDLGAQGEALRAAPNGRVVPLDPANPTEALVAAVVEAL